MRENRKLTLVLLIAVLCLAIWGNLSVGSIYIPQKDLFEILLQQGHEKKSWIYIVEHYRLPKVITSILVGVALSVSGLLMQTLFRNPMAGPYVLGLSSGAGLGVALVILGGTLLPSFWQPLLQSPYALVLASVGGSMLLLFMVLTLARKVRNSMTLLIIGLMFGSFANSLIAVLTYFSTAEELKRFTFWSLGNVGNLSWSSVLLFTIAVLLGLGLSIRSVKSLDAMLLGELYAQSLGISIQNARIWIIWATGILAGVCTAFVGPIAFIGLAVPHIARLLFQVNNHARLLLISSFIGAILMLFCDAFTQFPGQSFQIPINAITSILGAPLIILLLLKQK